MARTQLKISRRSFLASGAAAVGGVASLATGLPTAAASP
jgi:hypothetical protein